MRLPHSHYKSPKSNIPRRGEEVNRVNRYVGFTRVVPPWFTKVLNPLCHDVVGSARKYAIAASPALHSVWINSQENLTLRGSRQVFPILCGFTVCLVGKRDPMQKCPLPIQSNVSFIHGISICSEENVFGLMDQETVKSKISCK